MTNHLSSLNACISAEPAFPLWKSACVCANTLTCYSLLPLLYKKMIGKGDDESVGSRAKVVKSNTKNAVITNKEFSGIPKVALVGLSLNI